MKKIIAVMFIIVLLMPALTAFASDLYIYIDKEQSDSIVFLSREKLTCEQWINAPGKERKFCALAYFELINYLLDSGDVDSANEVSEIVHQAVANETIYIQAFSPWARVVFYGDQNRYVHMDYVPYYKYNDFTGGYYEGSTSFSASVGATDGTYRVYVNEVYLPANLFVQAVKSEYENVATELPEAEYANFD